MTDSRQATRQSDAHEILRLVEAARTNGAVHDGYTGKRRCTRYNGGLACEMSTDPTNDSALWFVSLHNVSGGGFACWSKTRLHSNIRVFLREFSAEQSGVWIPAIVRHCTAGIRGYLIGAAFENPLTSDGTPSGAHIGGPLAARPPRPSIPPAYARVQLPTRRM